MTHAPIEEAVDDDLLLAPNLSEEARAVLHGCLEAVDDPSPRFQILSVVVPARILSAVSASVLDAAREVRANLMTWDKKTTIMCVKLDTERVVYGMSICKPGACHQSN